MRKLKNGDLVTYSTWSGTSPKNARVESIEICKLGSKYGRKVNSCDLDWWYNGVIGLDNGHWIYFYQVRKIYPKKPGETGLKMTIEYWSGLPREIKKRILDYIHPYDPLQSDIMLDDEPKLKDASWRNVFEKCKIPVGHENCKAVVGDKCF